MIGAVPTQTLGFVGSSLAAFTALSEQYHRETAQGPAVSSPRSRENQLGLIGKLITGMGGLPQRLEVFAKTLISGADESGRPIALLSPLFVALC